MVACPLLIATVSCESGTSAKLVGHESARLVAAVTLERVRKLVIGTSCPKSQIVLAYAGT